MFDFKVITDRFYEVTLPDGKVLHLEPPKLKTLRAVEKSGDSVEDLSAAVSKLLSKNREGFKISPDQVMDMMDIDVCSAFMSEFFSWMNKEKASDPN